MLLAPAVMAPRPSGSGTDGFGPDLSIRAPWRKSNLRNPSSNQQRKPLAQTTRLDTSQRPALSIGYARAFAQRFSYRTPAAGRETKLPDARIWRISHHIQPRRLEPGQVQHPKDWIRRISDRAADGYQGYPQQVVDPAVFRQCRHEAVRSPRRVFYDLAIIRRWTDACTN